MVAFNNTNKFDFSDGCFYKRAPVFYKPVTAKIKNFFLHCHFVFFRCLLAFPSF